LDTKYVWVTINDIMQVLYNVAEHVQRSINLCYNKIVCVLNSYNSLWLKPNDAEYSKFNFVV